MPKNIPFHSIILLEKSEKLEKIDGTIHLILLAMAIEAFLQDVQCFYQAISASRISFSSNGSPFKGRNTTTSSRGCIASGSQAPVVFISDEELRLMTFIESMEKESPARKYEHIKNYLSLSEWRKGEDEEFKDLQSLIQLRNMVIHIKSDAIDLSYDLLIEKPPKIIENLKLKGVLPRGNQSTEAWIYLLDQKGFIDWCRITAKNNIASILSILPKKGVTEIFRSSYEQSLESFKF